MRSRLGGLRFHTFTLTSLTNLSSFPSHLPYRSSSMMPPSTVQEQSNTWTDTWSQFWAEHRIGDLVRRTNDKELIALESQLRDKVYPLLFNDEAMKSVKPSIIHGDLWSGNAGTDEETGQPIIFDPSSSYSHNEAELGIMKMFGGYGSDFFDAYHQVIPKAQPHYEQRLEMYEAYHHLNHFVIFGGGYRAGTVRLFKKLISWAEEELKGNGGTATADDDGSEIASASDLGSKKRQKGLRGGANGATTGSALPGTGCQDSTKGRRPPSSSSAGPLNSQMPAAPAVACNDAFDAIVSPASSVAPTPAQIADFFSQMVCYIWFSGSVTVAKISAYSNPSTPARSPVLAYQPQNQSPLTPRRQQAHNQRVSHAKGLSNASSSSGRGVSPVNALDMSRAMQNDLISSSVSSNSGTNLRGMSCSSEPSMQRLQPKGRFLRFVRELLSTTQLSTSVITLALVYVHRLKALHPHLQGRHGSEYRVGIAALMLANKILDDNTYLNKTWAEISGMPLIEISRMEVEFWLGLKMELHVSPENYESGLRDLHSLSLERTRMIQERETMLKRLSQQHIRTEEQYALMGGVHPHRLRNSAPYVHRQWNASSDALAHQPLVPDAVNAFRRSIGYAEHIPPSSYAPACQSTAVHAAHSPSVGFPPHACISPIQGMAYTLPSSPLSQGSGVPSLATTSNDALAYQSDVEAPTPQDTCSQYIGHDPVGFTSAIGGRGPHRGSGADHLGLQTPERMAHHAGPPPWSFNGPQHFSHEHARSASYNNTPGSSVTGLKRDFERANIGGGGASTNDGGVHAFKRFAYDFSNEPNTDRHRHVRLSSAGHYSPLDVSSWTYRPSSSSSPYAAYGNDLMRASASPSHVLAYPASGSQVVRPPSDQVREDHLASHSSALQRTGSATHPGYHSVFASALTPTALAAPLELSHTSWPMERVKAPLQYYSLAAGEAHGNVGTFFASAQDHGLAVLPTAMQHQQQSHVFPRLSHGEGYSDVVGPHFARPSSNKLPSYGISEHDLGRQVPPFQLDPQGWPLPVSSTPTYLFPYHLMPPQPEP